ncbi:redoxin domain-containing protein [Microcoleus sp. B7-D4]|uniref:redoxin domain-containing protein n=1 Tax=Microcoleus sp. B7-D4 TaxID=2818696 RepID=UPI002FD4C39D
MNLKSLFLCTFLHLVAQSGETGSVEFGSICKPDQITESKKFIGMRAPLFATKDSSAKPITLKNLPKKVTILVFIEKNCPCCTSGKDYIDRIEKYYGEETNILGVVVGTHNDAVQWKQRTKPRFTVVSDPKGRIAKSYGVVYSLGFRVIDTKGKIILSYPGYSEPMLKELTSKISTLSGVIDLEMPTSPAPAELTQGCPLDY